MKTQAVHKKCGKEVFVQWEVIKDAPLTGFDEFDDPEWDEGSASFNELDNPKLVCANCGDLGIYSDEVVFVAGDCECGNCSKRFDHEELRYPRLDWSRLDAGSIIPCAQCPECGAWVYLDDGVSDRRKW